MPVHAALRASVPTVRTGYGPVRRSDLGRWLAFDSSALTRNLRVLLDNKWLEQVTKAGASLLRALGPAWHKAQGRALAMVGGEGRAAVIGLFDKVQAAMAA
jgi:hypothetical protein